MTTTSDEKGPPGLTCASQLITVLNGLVFVYLVGFGRIDASRYS